MLFRRLALGALAALATLGTAPVASQEKIRIGIIGPFTGPFATTGIQYRQGIETFLSVNGNKIGGREVEVLYRDVGGTNPAVAKRLAEVPVPYVVYVACDPVALARDAATLHRSGYTLDRVDQFELFPETSHAEAVAVFTRGRP